MSNGQKLLVVALVAVVLLFVVAVALQARSEDGDAGTDQGGLVGLLGDRFGDPAGAELGELSGECLRPNRTLLVDGSCELRVAPSSERMRLVRLRTQQRIDVSAPAPEEADFDIEKELAAGDEVAIAVDSDGAEIELDCIGINATCTLTLIGGN